MDDREGERLGAAGWAMTDALLMDMVYVGCGIVAGLIIRKLVVTYCKRPWVGLTDEEVLAAWLIHRDTSEATDGFARAIEAKLKEKNHD